MIFLNKVQRKIFGPKMEEFLDFRGNCIVKTFMISTPCQSLGNIIKKDRMDGASGI
jgi:hypothetical protein